MRSFNLFHAAIVLVAIGLAATPAYAMKDPPKDEPISSSSGGSTSGGSTSGGGTPVPEPSSLALFGAGAAAFMMSKRRRKAKG